MDQSTASGSSAVTASTEAEASPSTGDSASSGVATETSSATAQEPALSGSAQASSESAVSDAAPVSDVQTSTATPGSSPTTDVAQLTGLVETIPVSNTVPPQSNTDNVGGTRTTSTKNWLPTDIIVESDTSAILTASNTAATQTSGLPRAITPASTSSPGEDFTVVTIGFKEALNYPFVVEHSLSSAQIFDYLPQVLTFPFTKASTYENVTVKRLVPYTATGINYVITVAEVYFPSNAVDALQQLVELSESKLYRNPDSTEQKLASLIDNRIPLIDLDTTRGTTSSSSLNNGSMDTSNSPIEKKGTVAGVATGAAVGTVLYMGVMVLLFRKYKQKKSIELPPSDSESNLGRESRTPSAMSLPSSGDGSGRPQISEPVNAFNSLGWTR